MGAQMTNKVHAKNNTNTSQTVRAIIAKECDMPIKSITNGMLFMANKNISFFSCMDILFDCEQRFHVALPEAAFQRFNTVGGLTRYIISHSNTK